MLTWRALHACELVPRFTWCSHSGNGSETACWKRASTTTTDPLQRTDVTYKAEYIWIDGTEPTARLRSKTKILADGAELPIWGFDGSSTNQAPGSNSDCVLQPVFSCPDPIRGGDNKLVMCEVLLTDMSPHPTNTRAQSAARCREVRRAGAAVRHRAGVHVLQEGASPRLPGWRLPGSAGLLLLRRRRRRGLRP